MKRVAFVLALVVSGCCAPSPHSDAEYRARIADFARAVDSVAYYRHITDSLKLATGNTPLPIGGAK